MTTKYNKYRKKPIVIEAIQCAGTWEQAAEIKKFAGDSYLEINDLDFKRTYVYLKTLEGEHIVSPKDYIIKGVKGEIYPCKPDIFEMTYEMVGQMKNIDEMIEKAARDNCSNEPTTYDSPWHRDREYYERGGKYVANLLKPEIERLQKVQDKILNICEGYTELMWSAKIISVILDCDFRDSKQALNDYNKLMNEDNL